MEERNFADLGRVEAIESLYEGTPYQPFMPSLKEVESGASVCHVSRMFLEGIDFNLVYFPLKHLGYKCVTAVTGELYASLCTPSSLDIILGISSKLDYSHIKELWSGIVVAAKEHGYVSVSLDMVPSRNGLAISAAAQGIQSQKTKFSKPASMDLLCVSGSLGAAYLGFRILERASKSYDESGTQPDLDKYRMMVGSYLKPELSPSILSHLEDSGIVPSEGCLVTRGLADAVKRLVRKTGLGAKIYADKIPFEGNSFEFGKELGVDPVSAAMNGGEDYCLLFAIPISDAEKFRHDFQTFDIIGHFARPEVGAVLVTLDGVELPLRAPGWKEPED